MPVGIFCNLYLLVMVGISWPLEENNAALFFDILAKFKFYLENNNNNKGELSCPQLGFVTKNLSVLYDIESKNSHFKGLLILGKNMHEKSLSLLFTSTQGRVLEHS
ncbi:hypothetical protein KSP40_PGU001340 [Platanthera guangdongensis]|uniref:Uncharacterized protein n=1 Tax=Platanthera guangdongensis TaxID=2320717 RepID=A0ABR2MKA5_9ASPA